MAAPAETDPAAPTPEGWRRWRAGASGRWLGILLTIALAAVILLTDLTLLARARYAAFDYYQLIMPRERKAEPPVIIAVDDDSLKRIGQWPWPRSVMAELIDRLAERKPSAIALDILFLEPDRSSPERVASALRSRSPKLAEQLARLRPNDEILAESIARAPVVLGISGIDAAPDEGAPGRARRTRGPMGITSFSDALRSLPNLDAAAQLQGIINVDPELGIVRRVPLAAYVAGDLVLSLPVAAYTVAQRRGAVAVSQEYGLSLLHVAEKRIPMESGGKAWLHFAPPNEAGASGSPWFGFFGAAKGKPAKIIRAADVIEGRDKAEDYAGKTILVGVTALALLDTHTTARGDRVPGLEIHGQILESVVDDAFLSRPIWMRYAEALIFLLGAGLLVLYVPKVPPRRSFAILLAWWLALLAVGVGAFYWARALFDPVTPILGVTIVYGFMLSATLVRLENQRRQLSTRLATQREAAARVTGELEAARRIQTGMLPTRESVLQYERRVELFAHMSAAREVGGDLYDFFPLSGDRFVVFVGDVSGKGLPAAMFMAVSKALAKSAAMRNHAAGPAEIMTILNAEISRENPEQNFVTVAALVINLKTGQLDYCNAGHEPPILSRRSGEILVLNDGGGPPVCVMEGYEYEQATIRLEPRDILVLASDGLTEAMNGRGELYGRQRLHALLDSPVRRNIDPTVLGNEILTAIRQFEAGSEPADDQTLLLVSWRGAL